MTDNLRLRRHLQDIEDKKKSIEELEQELGGIDAKHLERERRRLLAEQQEFLREVRRNRQWQTTVCCVCKSTDSLGNHCQWRSVLVDFIGYLCPQIDVIVSGDLCLWISLVTFVHRLMSLSVVMSACAFHWLALSTD